MFLINLHRLLDLFSLPDSSGRIMRRTENRTMDVILDNLLLHILIIHTPNAVFISHKIAENHFPSVIVHGSGKSDISRRVQQYRLARRGKRLKRRGHAAQHSVLVTDAFLCKSFHAETIFMPSDNTVEILIRKHKITKMGMFQTFTDRFKNRRQRWEIHIRHPHGNHRKSFRYLCIRNRNGIHSNCVMTFTVQNRRKIVLHTQNPFCCIF